MLILSMMIFFQPVRVDLRARPEKRDVDPDAIVTDTLQGIRQFWLQTNGDYHEKNTIAHVYTVPWWIDRLSDDTYQSYFISSLIQPSKIAHILSEVKPDILSLYPRQSSFSGASLG